MDGNIPKIEGEIYMKVGKHKWKKGLFTVRASGLYISKSGKSLVSVPRAFLASFVMLDGSPS